MMPDKIYLEQDGGRFHVFLGLQPEKATEYIRKEALLEYLRERENKYRFINDEGYIELEEVINKLNSL